jgi:K+-sensing histidine kinase KdpD
MDDPGGARARLAAFLHHQGTGPSLGLTIARPALAGMQASLEFTNEPQGCARFSARMPQERAALGER